MKETGKNGGKVRQPPKTASLGDAEPLIALSKAKPKTAKVRFCENSACQSRLSIHNKSRFCYRCQETVRNKKLQQISSSMPGGVREALTSGSMSYGSGNPKKFTQRFS